MLENIEIERKYFTEKVITDVPNTVSSFDCISEDRYYMSPSGLIRLRDDTQKGIEITAKTYGKDNIHRREINLGMDGFISIKDCLEFMEVAGFTLRLHFKQKLNVWIGHEVVVSQTEILDEFDNPYNFDMDLLFMTYNKNMPIARFVEIEAKDPETKDEGIRAITKYQKALHLKNSEIVHYSLIQLFGAYPR